LLKNKNICKIEIKICLSMYYLIHIQYDFLSQQIMSNSNVETNNSTSVSDSSVKTAKPYNKDIVRTIYLEENSPNAGVSRRLCIVYQFNPETGQVKYGAAIHSKNAGDKCLFSRKGHHATAQHRFDNFPVTFSLVTDKPKLDKAAKLKQRLDKAAKQALVEKFTNDAKQLLTQAAKVDESSENVTALRAAAKAKLESASALEQELKLKQTTDVAKTFENLITPLVLSQIRTNMYVKGVDSSKSVRKHESLDFVGGPRLQAL
jgi:hypothetical protein